MAEFTQDMLGTAAGTIGVSQEEIPLAMRIAGSAPGILTAAGFMNYRGANTLLEGGRFDYLDAEAGGLRGRKARRIQSKYRVFDSNNVISPMNTRQYYGSRGVGPLSNRAARKVSLGKGSNFNLRASMASFRPPAARRHGSITSYMDPKMGIYSPYSISGIASNFGPVKRKMASTLADIGVTNIADNQTLLGPGLLSFISAGRKIDKLEKKALRGNQRALSKLGRVDQNIQNLLAKNNPQLLARTSVTTHSPLIQGAYQNVRTAGSNMVPAPQRLAQARAAGLASGAPVITQLPSTYDNIMRDAVKVKGFGQVGARSMLMGAAMPGQFGQAAFGYVNAAVGGATYVDQVTQKLGDDQALVKGAKKALDHLAGSGTKKYMAVGARTLGLAIPGLNILAAASLAYDIGNMAGQVIKSGINLARDATKSMQGSIYKPLFGMGYKDTEAAATSRQRGVMAIQNSRLNARSMLGSEAGMLAARYG